MNTKKTLFLIMLLCFAISCTTNKKQASQWSDSEAWFQNNDSIDSSLVDVFYIVSTNVVSATDENGKEIYNATLNATDRKYYSMEMDYAKGMFSDSLNFFSPFYHQATLNNFTRPEAEQVEALSAATAEVVEAFDYYMQNLNGGRKFIIAGFSQGAIIAIDLIKHLSPEQYSRMVAAYVIGYRLAANDIEHDNIIPAEDEFSTGVTISFNSAMSAEGIWHQLSDGAVTCINPLSWSTDSIPAQLIFDSDTAMVNVDKKHNVLFVKGLDVEDYQFPVLSQFAGKGNLHHWDLLFYRDAIKRNALNRAYQ